MAKRRSSKQVAASRRNLVKARASRKRRVATAVVLGGAVAYAGYKASHVNVYHSTSGKNAHNIVKGGFNSHLNNTKYLPQAAYFSTKKRKTKVYGPATVKGTMSRRAFHKHSSVDVEYQKRSMRRVEANSLHHVKKLKVVRGKRIKSMV
jgi:hypothetical protein